MVSFRAICFFAAAKEVYLIIGMFSVDSGCGAQWDRCQEDFGGSGTQYSSFIGCTIKLKNNCPMKMM